jgi:hypothetical protein
MRQLLFSFVEVTGCYFSIALVFMIETMVTFYGNVCLFFVFSNG